MRKRNTRTRFVFAFLSSALLFAALLLPAASFAGSGGSAITGRIPNPLGEGTTLYTLLKKIFDAIVKIAVPVSALFIVYAGFLFVTAQGSDDKITKARIALTNALIGIAIILGAWTLSMIIKNTVQSLG